MPIELPRRPWKIGRHKAPKQSGPFQLRMPRGSCILMLTPDHDIVTAEPQDTDHIDYDLFLLSKDCKEFYADPQDGFAIVASDIMGLWHILVGKGLSLEAEERSDKAPEKPPEK